MAIRPRNLIRIGAGLLYAAVIVACCNCRNAPTTLTGRSATDQAILRSSLPDSLEILAPPPGHISVDLRRRIFPYSVVPGGVFSREEFREAVRSDPVAARHYGEVRPERLIQRRLSETRRYFASYRKDGQVYWTSRAITVPEGEWVLTDGEAVVRARCGNLLSEEMRLPILPRYAEPTEIEFDEPKISESTKSIWGRKSIFFLPPFWLPIILLPPGGPRPPETPPPVEPVPEPSTWILVTAGLVFLGLGLRFRR